MRRKGLVVVGVPVAALLGVILAIHLAVQAEHHAEQWIDHTIEVRNLAQNVLLSLERATGSVRGYLLTGDDRFLAPHASAQRELPGTIDSLKSRVRDNPTQLGRVSRIEMLMDQRLENLETQIDLRERRGSIPAATLESLLIDSKAVMDELRAELGAVIAEEERLLAERNAVKERSNRTLGRMLLGSLVLGLGGGVIAMSLFTRSIACRVQRIEHNATRLARRQPLLPMPPADDEIGRLGRRLEETSAILDEQSAWIRRALESAQALIWEIDPATGQIRYDAAPETLENSGITPHMIPPTTNAWLDLVHPEDRPRVEQELGRAIADDTALDIEYRVVLPDERLLWLAAKGEKRRDRRGVPILAGLLTDITARKQAEETLRQTQALVASIVQIIPHMVFVKDAEDLRFVLLNKAGEELLGFSEADLIGKNDYDFFPREQADFYASHDREVLQNRIRRDIPEESIQTRHQGERVLHTKKVPILDADGNPQYLLGISEDITERKQVEEVLRRATREAEEANRAKSEFLSRMSHELRTPLNAILGFAQLLDMEQLTEAQRESVSYILRAGRHLLGLINEVLDISRIEAGRLPISLEPVQIGDTLQESLSLIRPAASQRQIRLETITHDLCDRFVLADRQRLKQVLLNLLSNAVKYNRDAGTVTIVCREVPDQRLRVAIRDTGDGITPHSVARLFNPFDRLGADQSGIEGTGLGLALSKRLVELMGGSMGVESVVHEGSTFWIELPLVDGPAGEHHAPADVEATARDHGREYTVLYIEDNLSNLTLLERVIARRPQVRLLTTMQGGIGIDLAREHRPDLILLDLHLPDLAGMDVLRRLQAMPETRTIPAIVVSADATPGQIERLIAAGARNYLSKPLDIKAFLQTLDDMMMESQQA